MRVDLNSDLGEGFGLWRMGDDAAMLDVVTSANIACGFHAGDPDIMFETAALAKAKGVAIGAHPGFADLAGFGRRIIPGLSAGEIERLVAYQIGALQGVAALAGHHVTYVKPHGALSNMANDDEDLAMAIGRAIRSVDRALIYMVMPRRPTEAAALALEMPLAREIFADRAYDFRANLVSRKLPGAVIHDPEIAAARALRMLEDRAVVADDGRKLSADIDTICVHGDTPQAVAIAAAVRAKLESAGVTLAPFAPPGR